jgi:hypothetical protein
MKFKRSMTLARIVLVVLVTLSCVRASPARACPAYEAGYPQCGAWSSLNRLYPSPSIAQDDTIFSWGAVPTGSNFASRFLRSTEGGLTWSEVQLGQYASVSDLAFSPNYAQDRTLFVSTLASSGAKIHRSTNDGSSWNEVPLPSDSSRFTTRLAVLDGQRLFAAITPTPW